MFDLNQGLNESDNLLEGPACDGPRVENLCRLLKNTDQAVLTAYDWSETEAPKHANPKTAAERDTLAPFEDEVIDRLLVLNDRRSEEGQVKGLGGNRSKSAPKRRGPKRNEAPFAFEDGT